MVSGCNAPYGLDYGTIKKVVAISAGIEDPPGITLSQASAIPFSSIGYRIGKSSEGILILASKTDGQLLWTSADRIALITAAGRIVKTGGLRWDLSDTVFREPDPLKEIMSLSTTPVQSRRLVDFRDIGKFSVTIATELKRLGPQSITVLGSEIPTIAFSERCETREFDWSFENQFWADSDTGFIWKTRQNIHPNLDPIMTEIFRQPA
jgi:hypothetical protein